MLSSHVKRSRLLWLHDTSRLRSKKNVKAKWFVVYIINRTLHDRLEIRNFSSRVEKYFTRSLRSLVKYFSTLEEKFRISARPCNILHLLHQTLNTFLSGCTFLSLSDCNISSPIQLRATSMHVFILMMVRNIPFPNLVLVICCLNGLDYRLPFSLY